MGLLMFGSAAASRLGFAGFELDLRTRELRKHGARLELSGQPIDVLAILLERQGEVVTRQDLRARLWPAETFVDFEHSLNAAISKLRQTLGDSPRRPVLIETLPRRGYRFLAPVENAAPAEAAPGPSGPIRLAVLPFANLHPDPAQEFFSDGLTEGMITQLACLHPEQFQSLLRRVGLTT